MGEHNVNSENGPQELRGFIKHLLNDIRALEKMSAVDP